MRPEDRLASAPLASLIARFSLPLTAALLVNALYNLVDRVFVGRGIGPAALAGVTVAFPLFILVSALGMLFGLGGAAVLSIALGEGDRRRAAETAGVTAVAGFVSGALLAAAALAVLDPLLVAFGGGGEVLVLARRFARVALAGVPFQVSAITLTCVLRGAAAPGAALAVSLVGAAVNLVLNPLFIFGLHLGVAGSALATLTGEVTGCVLAARLLLRGVGLRPRWPARPDRWDRLRPVLALGFPPCAMQLALCVLMAVSNRAVVALGGAAGIAAMGVLYVLYPLVLMPLTGLGGGVQPILGFNHGARRPARVRRTLLVAIALATGVCVAAWLVLLPFAGPVVRLFLRGDPALEAACAHALRLFFPLLPLVGLQVIGASYYQAVGRAGISFLLNLVRQVLLLLPLLALLPRVAGLDGVWLANPASDLAAALLTGGFVAAELRRLRRVEAEEGASPAAPAARAA